MTAVDPLSVSCDEQTCRAPAGAGCIGRECQRDGNRATFPCAPHATRIGKARAVADARDEIAVDPLLTSCPRDNCEEAGHACIEWEVVEVGADGRPTASRARVVEPHPDRVEKAERLVRQIEEQDAACAAYNAARATIRDVESMIGTLIHSRHLPTIALAVKAMIDAPAIADAIVHAPVGVEAIGRVLAKGGATLGVVGSAPDRTPLAHARKAAGHLRRALAAIDPDDRAPWAVDADTGELHATCAAGRLALAIEGVMR